ncbi:MAG: MFS transporter, partial [Thermodesulfobacteriota bacterium]
KHFRDHLGFIFLLTSIFFINFISRIILAPIIPAMEKDLGLSHTESGTLFLLISTGYFISLLSSGFFSSRFTHRQTIICSGIGLGIALLGASISQGLWAIRISLLFLGMAAGLYLPSGIAMITTTFASRHWGKAIAIHEVAPNLSFVVAPLLSEVVMLRFDWRNVFVVLGVTGVALILLFIRYGTGGRFHGQSPNVSSIRGIVTKPSFWTMVLLFGLGISGTLGVFTMLSVFLVNTHGFERNPANTLVSFSRIAGMVMTFAGGWLTDRIGAKRVLMAVFLFSGLTTASIGIASSSYVAIPILLQPIIASCFFPAGLAALSLMSRPELRNLVVSLTVPIAFLVGGGLVPTLIGFVGDVSSFSVGIFIVGVLILSGAFISAFMNSRNRF